MDHGTQVVLWVMGRLDALVERGWVKSGSWVITPRGRAQYDQLHASGFRPSLDDIIEAMMDSGLVSLDEAEPLALMLLAEDDEETCALCGEG